MSISAYMKDRAIPNGRKVMRIHPASVLIGVSSTHWVIGASKSLKAQKLATRVLPMNENFPDFSDKPRVISNDRLGAPPSYYPAQVLLWNVRNKEDGCP